MSGNLKIGQIWNIPIMVNASWFLIFALVTWTLASGYFPQEYPDLPGTVHIAMGVLTSLLFFGSVLLHELGHSWLALRNGIPVRGITLFIFGGIAQIEEEPHTPGAEFWIAIAGPLTSALLAGLFGLTWLLDKAVPYLAAPSNYLLRINLILAIFNLVPGFPLDGGRVLRAIVWKATGNKHRATQVATATGQIIAFGFIGWGVFRIFQGDFFNGLWLAFIGWFLQQAAASTQAQENLQQALRNVRVGQVMQPEHPQVSSLLTVRQLVDDRVLNGGQRYFCVTDPQGTLEGCLTLQDISRIPQEQWAFTPLSKVAVPLDRMVTVTPDTMLLDALQGMDRSDVSKVPVLQEGQVVGVLSREDVLHYVRLRAELGLSQ